VCVCVIAPGNEDYNFSQLLLFDGCEHVNVNCDNIITLPPYITMPTGCILDYTVFNSFLNLLVVFQLQLLTTWGDPYYVGLNGLEVYNEDGSQLVLTNNSILLPC